MDIFSALADPTRRSILEMLAARGALPATQIYDAFAASRPAISQHLKVLREAGLVQVEKRAQQRIYALNPAAMQAVEGWARGLVSVWQGRFDALERVIAAEKARQDQTQTDSDGSVQEDTHGTQDEDQIHS